MSGKRHRAPAPPVPAPRVGSELMAEVLKLSLVDGKSARNIAKRLGLSRNTVRRMLAQKPSRGGTAVGEPEARRTSLLMPYEPTIATLLAADPTIKAPAVLERLRPLGYAGGVSILRDRLHQLRPRPRQEAFLTVCYAPGAVMEVDWADFGFAIPGCPRRVSALVMTLAYSRYLYLDFTLSQAYGSFLRAFESGLFFFGGTTAIDIFDNMKTVVLRHTPTAVEYNQSFLAYSRLRGFAVHACTPYQPHEKGGVERSIRHVRDRFWPGRRFASLLDLNTQGATWRDDFCNNRIHDTTGKVPSLVFTHEEQKLLKPLGAVHPETDDLDTATVTKSFRVTFDRCTYSAPPRLVGQPVLIRANDEQVRVILGDKPVALHRRCWNAGKDIEDPEHREQAWALKQRPAGSDLPPGLADLGDLGRAYFKIFAANGRSLAKETRRLVYLAELFGIKALASAMDEVMHSGHVGTEYIEYVLRHKRGLAPGAPPLRLGDPQLDALSFGDPDLAAYDAIMANTKTLDPREAAAPAPGAPPEKESP